MPRAPLQLPPLRYPSTGACIKGKVNVWKPLGFHKNHAHRWTWRLCYVCINLNDMWQFQTWQYTWQYNGPACLCDIDLIEGHWCIGVLRLTSFEVFEKEPSRPIQNPYSSQVPPKKPKGVKKNLKLMKKKFTLQSLGCLRACLGLGCEPLYMITWAWGLNECAQNIKIELCWLNGMAKVAFQLRTQLIPSMSPSDQSR